MSDIRRKRITWNRQIRWKCWNCWNGRQRTGWNGWDSGYREYRGHGRRSRRHSLLSDDFPIKIDSIDDFDIDGQNVGRLSLAAMEDAMRFAHDGTAVHVAFKLRFVQNLFRGVLHFLLLLVLGNLTLLFNGLVTAVVTSIKGRSGRCLRGRVDAVSGWLSELLFDGQWLVLLWRTRQRRNACRERVGGVGQGWTEKERTARLRLVEFQSMDGLAWVVSEAACVSECGGMSGRQSNGS